MLTILEAPGDVVALKYSGALTRADVDASFALCREKLARNQEISAYVDLTDFTGFTAAGLWEDLQEGVTALAWMGRVKRKAIVTDAKAYHALTAFSASLITHPDVRAFPTSEAKAAFEWACSGP